MLRRCAPTLTYACGGGGGDVVMIDSCGRPSRRRLIATLARRTCQD
jgi:hypothetical protein